MEFQPESRVYQLLVSGEKETSYGKAVSKAWDRVLELDRDLMLFSWAMKQKMGEVRNDVGHPKPSVGSACSVLDEDMLNRASLKSIAQDFVFSSGYFRTE